MKTKLFLLLGFGLGATAALAQPTIQLQLADRTVNKGYDTTFTMSARGTPPLSYNWFFNQTPVAGTFTNRLIFTNAQPANAGDYFAIVNDSTGSVTSRVAKLTVITPAVLDPRIGANLLLGAYPKDWPVSGRSAAEPHMIRSFTDASLVAAVYVYYRFTNSPQVAAVGYSLSHDGGLSWRPGLVENSTKFTGGKLTIAGDPVAGIDLDGNIYLCAIADFTTSGFTTISKMTNGGLAFAPPVNVIKTSAYDEDKPWIAINTYSNSPHANRIVAAFNAPNSGPLRSTYSDDGGATWSKPIFITQQQGHIGVVPVFFPDGSLTILSTDFDSRIEIAFSPDGGQTLGTNRLVTKFVRYEDPRSRPGPGVVPSLTTDRQAGVLYLSYQTKLGQGTNARPSIMFTRSIDRGETWTIPIVVNDTPNRRSVFGSVIAASPDGQHVIIQFYDKRNDTGQGYLVDLYITESFDGGDTWQPNLRVTEFSSDLRKAELTADGTPTIGDYFGLVPALGLGANAPAVACWIDMRSGSADPYSAQIQRTRGATFETWRKLRWGTNDLANPALSGPNADPDGDGIPNFSEYALGLEPNHPDNGVLQTQLIGAPASAPLLQVSFRHPNVLADVQSSQFSWEESSDLVHWQTSHPNPILSQPSVPPPFWITETWFFPVESVSQKFVRLVVKPQSQ